MNLLFSRRLVRRFGTWPIIRQRCRRINKLGCWMIRQVAMQWLGRCQKGWLG